MEQLVIKTLTSSFEEHAQNQDGVEFWYARDLQKLLEYQRWEKFMNVIEKAISIVRNGLGKGSFIDYVTDINIGSGAKRQVADYKVDREGAILLIKLSSKNKLNNINPLRIETVILQQIKKYCLLKNIDFSFQYHCKPYRFDCKIGKDILVEFQEQHHQTDKAQRATDEQKRLFAKEQGYRLLEITVKDDIIDVIVKLQNFLNI
jgi:hypothetical protein